MKSLRSAACQKSPCCCLEAYSRSTFTVLLLLRVEQLLDPIQLREYISKDVGSVVGSRGHMVEQVGARGRCEAQVQELGEATPHRGALLLDLEEPRMSAIVQMTGSHPYLFFLHDALSTEVCVAAVDEDERVGITVVTRKTQLLEPRRTIVEVFPGSRAVAGRRALSGQGLDGGGVGLHGGLEVLQGVGVGHHGGCDGREGSFEVVGAGGGGGRPGGCVGGCRCWSCGGGRRGVADGAQERRGDGGLRTAGGGQR